MLPSSLVTLSKANTQDGTTGELMRALNTSSSLQGQAPTSSAHRSLFLKEEDPDVNQQLNQDPADEVWVAVLVQVHISKRVGPGGALWAGWRPHSIRWVTEDGF